VTKGNDLRDDWKGDEPRFFDRAGEVTIWWRRLHGVLSGFRTEKAHSEAGLAVMFGIVSP